MLTPRKVNSMPKAQNASEERRIEEFQSEKQRNQENNSRKIKLKESHNMEVEEHENHPIMIQMKVNFQLKYADRTKARMCLLFESSLN
jgi:hypothetical protein